MLDGRDTAGRMHVESQARRGQILAAAAANESGTWRGGKRARDVGTLDQIQRARVADEMEDIGSWEMAQPDAEPAFAFVQRRTIEVKGDAIDRCHAALPGTSRGTAASPPSLWCSVQFGL